MEDMSVELLQNKVHKWNLERKEGQRPVLVGFKQAKLLQEANQKKFDPTKLRLCASRKLPWTRTDRSSMVTLVFCDSAARREFLEWSKLEQWYYYSQPPPTRDASLPVRAYIDLDAHDSKSEAGFAQLEDFAKTKLWPALCDFLGVHEDLRQCILSTNHKSRDGSFQGSVHIQSTGFAFRNIFHYSRCFHAFLRSIKKTELMNLSWELYGGKSSKNAQATGVIDSAPIGRETGTGYHKWNETLRKHEAGLDVWDYDILGVPEKTYIVKKLRLSTMTIAAPPVSTCSSAGLGASPGSGAMSPQIDPSWFKTAEFTPTAIARMEPFIYKFCGSKLSDVRLSRLSRPSVNPDGADYMVVFPSTPQSKCCTLSNVRHGSNNIKMMLSLSPPRLWVGCHSTKREACNRWKLVYEERTSPLPPPGTPTATVPAGVVGKGTHIELCVWTLHPFRISIPGYEDVTNRDDARAYHEMEKPPKLSNVGGSFMPPEIRAKRTSRAARDMCFRLRALSKRSAEKKEPGRTAKKQRT